MGLKELLRFPRLLRRTRHEPAAAALYSAAVVQARRPEFFARWDVADTVDGRFDMVALHVFLLLRRLRADGERSRNLSQALFDIMFADMDQNLRELGVGDMGVGKRIRRMAEAFYGRIAAYDAGLDMSDPAVLEAALTRNLWRGSPPEPDAVAAVAAYMRRQDAALAAQPLAPLLEGRVAFGDPVP